MNCTLNHSRLPVCPNSEFGLWTQCKARELCYDFQFFGVCHSFIQSFHRPGTFLRR
jgi:hypothetical protein